MYPLAKRLIDIVLAAVLLVVVLPVYVCLAVIIKLTSRGPVLFKQERTGLGGKPFTLLKFRSMAADNNVMDASSADKLTGVGRVMRKLSLDELPQLFNVLCGDMSFIGPRPWIPEYHKHMTPRQKRRLSVRPGITGLAQIKGRNGIGIHDKIKYDLRYVDHLNFREDLKVLVLTFLALWDKTAEDFGKSGIHQELAELKANLIDAHNDNTLMPKKVLFTATVDSHILQFHLPFLEYFKQQGYEVHVATSGSKNTPHTDKKHMVPFSRSPFSTDNLRAIKELKKIIDTNMFELIHTHTPMGSVVTRIAAFGARKSGTRVIYTAHGFHFFKGAPKINWILYYPVEKILARITDRLIAINQEDYKRASSRFRTKVDFIPGVGIDTRKFNKLSVQRKNELRASLGISIKDIVIIYPAELSKRKRQIWLIKALKSNFNNNPRLHLLLPGQDSLHGECQRLVTSLDLGRQVHLIGYRKDITDLLQIADISVSSARQEGLPVNLLEAMYAGLPIVASDCRGNRDLVEHAKTGYLIGIKDAQTFAEKVASLTASKKLRRKLGLYGQQSVQTYMLDRTINGLAVIYAEEMSRATHRRHV